MERTCFHGITRRLAVAAVTNIAGIAFSTCGLESLDGFSFSKHRFGTTVKLDEIEMVRTQPAQTSLNAFQQGITRPIFTSDPARMAAFRKEIVVAPAFADCFSDQFFAAFIAFASVDNIQPGVERALEQASDSFLIRSF